MSKFNVVWSIELNKTVEADSEEEALDIAANLDCQHDGNYIEQSFDIKKIEKLPF